MPQPPKPRKRAVTEIRGPYYTPMGKRYLRDVLETMGTYVDALKFAGGSFSLMPRDAVRELLDLCHEYEVEVPIGGFMEDVLSQGPGAVIRKAISWPSPKCPRRQAAVQRIHGSLDCPLPCTCAGGLPNTLQERGHCPWRPRMPFGGICLP